MAITHPLVTETGSIARQQDSNAHPAVHGTGVMARLHALFPTHDTHCDVPESSVKRGPIIRHTSRPLPKSIKVRILTWNMHDSVPKGDLEELLGQVHPYENISDPPGELPDLPQDGNHPYHLVIVAGQECPSLSGLPMALGAGFKLLDKDRDKSKDRDKDREKDKEKEKEKERDKEQDHEERPRHRLSRHLSSYRPHHDEEVVTSSSASGHEHTHHHAHYGWSSMLEDWYCKGVGSSNVPAKSTSLFDASNHDAHGYFDGYDDIPMSPKAQSTGDLIGRMSTEPARDGPYELLIKERMMGLYLAVYILKDIKGLVRGMSKSAVTAGLIGGRVGNKGGVGVSINLAGHTFLFINAHLAAHEGRVQHRLANLAKIKNELNVDDFLEPNDPRVMAEDVTDRFDHTFIFGDLNFRLDITRLHADWLISRKEYEQAFAFDQLRKILQNGEAFVGFQEAPIDFPPTFKYDVLRTLKRHKHRSSKFSSRNLITDIAKHEKTLTEIEEKDGGSCEGDKSEKECKSDEEFEGEGGEATSLASSAWTSRSKFTEGEDREQEPEEFSYYSPAMSRNRSSVRNSASHKLWTSSAAHKAKAKFISLLSTSSNPVSPLKFKFRPRDPRPGTPPISPSFPPSPVMPEFRTTTLPPTPGISVTTNEVNEKFLMANRSPGPSEQGRGPSPLAGRTDSTKSMTNKSEERDETDGEGKGVYDSSHKQRVPSWCDRILWKTTVDPGPELPEEEETLEETLPPPLPPRNRVGNFLHSLRPASLRSRKDSIASTETPLATLPQDSLPASPYESENEGSMDHHHSPRSPRSHQPPRRLSRSRSNDLLPSSVERPYMPRTRTHIPPLDLHSKLRRTSLLSLSGDRGKSTVTTPPPTALLRESEYNTPAINQAPPPLPPKDFLPTPIPVTSLWRSFSFLPFLSRDALPSNSPHPSRPLTPESPPPPPPRKGDIVCLDYRTLDDRGMRKLEGRSDHRPVIGSYAVYI